MRVGLKNLLSFGGQFLFEEVCIFLCVEVFRPPGCYGVPSLCCVHSVYLASLALSFDMAKFGKHF